MELAEEHRPDLVILDVKMPVLDGISAAERIAGERIAPVLMLTAFSQRELVERARDAGAMAYLVKPFTKSDLVPGDRDGRLPVTGDAGAGDGGRGPAASGWRRASWWSGRRRVLQTRVRADGAGGVPLDPEDVDGPADVDAAGGRGGDRGGRRGAEAPPARVGYWRLHDGSTTAPAGTLAALPATCKARAPWSAGLTREPRRRCLSPRRGTPCGRLVVAGGPGRCRRV